MDLALEFMKIYCASTISEACERAVAKFLGRCDRASLDLIRVAESKDVQVEFVDKLQTEGEIERDLDGRCCIRLRAGVSRRRARFTLAHELGHWLLQESMGEKAGLGKGKLFRGLSTNSHELQQEERLANLLAAEILLPRNVVVTQCKTGEKKFLSRVRELCLTYQTSRVVVLRRVADVLRMDLLYLQFVPSSLQDYSRPAILDDAICITSEKATLYCRERTRLLEPITFSALTNATSSYLQVNYPNGRWNATFEFDKVKSPIPQVFALSVRFDSAVECSN